MKPLQIAQDIVPVGQFKAHASQLIRQLREEHRSIVITQNGKPSAVLITPEDFDRLHNHDRFLEAVNVGLEDSEAGRLTDDSDLGAELDHALGTAAE